MAAPTSTEANGGDDEMQQPLLPNSGSPPDAAEPTALQNAITQTYKSAADLANHLPTGTVLAFHVLAPVFTSLGRCSPAGRIMTSALLALCALSCFIQSFTDSFTDAAGRVRYGFATRRGLWVIDALPPLEPKRAAAYRLRAVDFVHAVTSLVVFAAVAMLDRSVVACFFPAPSGDAEQVLAVLPVGVGVLGSMLLVTFPTTRHGIGFPVTRREEK